MQAAAQLAVPCFAMIRPRSGLFRFSDVEVRIMLADIRAARDAGLAGVVLGVQNAAGGFDLPILRQLIEAAGPMGRTLHRVIDVVPDPLVALDQAMSLGFDRVLTSGAQPLAPDGADLIREMVRRSDGKMSVMPGCGLTPENVRSVLERTGADEVHASCHEPVPGDPAFSDFDPVGGRQQTSTREVARMVAALKGPG